MCSAPHLFQMHLPGFYPVSDCVNSINSHISNMLAIKAVLSENYKRQFMASWLDVDLIALLEIGFMRNTMYPEISGLASPAPLRGVRTQLQVWHQQVAPRSPHWREHKHKLNVSKENITQQVPTTLIQGKLHRELMHLMRFRLKFGNLTLLSFPGKVRMYSEGTPEMPFSLLILFQPPQRFMAEKPTPTPSVSNGQGSPLSSLNYSTFTW